VCTSTAQYRDEKQRVAGACWTRRRCRRDIPNYSDWRRLGRRLVAGPASGRGIARAACGRCEWIHVYVHVSIAIWFWVALYATLGVHIISKLRVSLTVWVVLHVLHRRCRLVRLCLPACWWYVHNCFGVKAITETPTRQLKRKLCAYNIEEKKFHYYFFHPPPPNNSDRREFFSSCYFTYYKLHSRASISLMWPRLITYAHTS
jgi:hypothetical protein